MNCPTGVLKASTITPIPFPVSDNVVWIPKHPVEPNSEKSPEYGVPHPLTSVADVQIDFTLLELQVVVLCEHI